MLDELPTTIRGRVLAPDPATRTIVDWLDALIHVDAAGVITRIEAAPASTPVPPTWPGSVIVPGFVDTHLHFPQTKIVGSATGPLLEWLERSVFPEETRFVDREYATTVAATFCQRLAAAGTTCAGVYSSAHPAATEVLFEALDRAGLRATAGLTLMDRGAPAEVILDAATALATTADLVDRWHGHDDDRLRVAVVPRFALSCTPELLRGAARLARERAILVQTHLSENLAEITAAVAAFPGSRDYLSVYEDHGCVGSHVVFAHCVHLSHDEWGRLAAADMAVAHCPDSNFFLGSGCMPLRHALDHGVRVGLGTDIGAGRTFSIRRVAASAYDAALVCRQPVTPTELLWLATRGGSLVLGRGGRTGCIAAGYEADLVAIDVDDLTRQDTARVIDAVLFDHDAGPVRATMVRGRVVHER